ncbi:hypothetical protein [Leucothrix arctica]|uniref:HPt domain-containing protein n=1 Tax=Leucothrix arctica TaxID=1481894 RepID=A0A317CLJ8_9GAMM|nr:hypothetical protein [Leucothrix arctica]PWQ97160.1 hypothetical protein DKT75_07545 [Leucothrix arctica]
MNNKSSKSAIEASISAIGIDNVRELLIKALPIIETRKSELLALLDSGDTSRATDSAHRTISSIRLYGSDRLEKLLIEVKDQSYSTENLSKICADILQEFDSVIATVNEWLEDNKN